MRGLKGFLFHLLQTVFQTLLVSAGRYDLPLLQTINKRQLQLRDLYLKARISKGGSSYTLLLAQGCAYRHNLAHRYLTCLRGCVVLSYANRRGLSFMYLEMFCPFLIFELDSINYFLDFAHNSGHSNERFTFQSVLTWMQTLLSRCAWLILIKIFFSFYTHNPLKFCAYGETMILEWRSALQI